MANRESSAIEITPEVLLKAYACGIFPMAESAEDPALYWIEPEMRGIIPLDGFHLPARLARTVRSDRFTVTVNRDFDGVLDGCASPLPGRPRTWINARIRTLYRKLHERRHSHSLEVYDGDRTRRRALRRDARRRVLRRKHVPSRARCFEGRARASGGAAARPAASNCCDTQFVTEHLKSFGAIEVPKPQYHRLLEAALSGEADFAALRTDRPVTGAEALALLAEMTAQRLGAAVRPAG